MSDFAYSCRPSRRHRFDYWSGWCIHGCGVRDDQHVVSRTGEVLREGPTYTPAELENFRGRHERRSPDRKV